MKRFTNIALVVDSAADNESALERAATLAARNRAKLTLVAVAPDVGPIADVALREAMADGVREELRHLLERAPRFLPDIHTQLLEGVAAIAIIRAVVEAGFDLVIKAAEPSDPPTETLGPVDKKLLRKCPCPVWLVRDNGPTRYERVLVAIDYRPDSPDNDALNTQLLQMSGSLAQIEGAELHVAHAWQIQGEGSLRWTRTGLTAEQVDAFVRAVRAEHKQWLEETVAAQVPRDEGERAPVLHLLEGRARQAIPKLTETLDVDLVLMGTVGRTGIPGYFIGNTAEVILGRIDCAVLAVKPPGFVCPVAAA